MTTSYDPATDIKKDASFFCLPYRNPGGCYSLSTQLPHHVYAALDGTKYTGKEGRYYFKAWRKDTGSEIIDRVYITLWVKGNSFKIGYLECLGGLSVGWQADPDGCRAGCFARVENTSREICQDIADHIASIDKSVCWKN